jgi:hypothetical protein
VRPCEQRGKGQQRGDRHGKAGTAAGGEAQAGRAEAGGGEGEQQQRCQAGKPLCRKALGVQHPACWRCQGRQKRGEKRGASVHGGI